MEDNSKTVISFTKPTPKWATWAFRTVFCFTTAITFWLAGTRLVADNNKMEIMLLIKSVDFVVWGIGRSIGVSKDEFEAEEK